MLHLLTRFCIQVKLALDSRHTELCHLLDAAHVDKRFRLEQQFQKWQAELEHATELAARVRVQINAASNLNDFSVFLQMDAWR